MEALTAAAVAALTVYDMVKGVDRSAACAICGCSRNPAASRGMAPPPNTAASDCGRSRRPEEAVSQAQRRDDAVGARADDQRRRGRGHARHDESGEALAQRLTELGFDSSAESCRTSRKDRHGRIDASERVELVVSTGGTGLGPRDQTPQTLHGLLDSRSPVSASRCAPRAGKRPWPTCRAARPACWARRW